MTAAPAPQAELAAFHNRLRCLFNLDGPDLGSLPQAQQNRFLLDPVEYFLRADDPTRDTIWEAVERRHQRARERGL